MWNNMEIWIHSAVQNVKFYHCIPQILTWQATINSIFTAVFWVKLDSPFLNSVLFWPYLGIAPSWGYCQIMHFFLHLLYTHTRLTTFFSRTTWVSRHQKGKVFWILLKQEMMGWEWQQLDHMQIICTTLQTDNHTSTPSLNFYRPDALPGAQPTVSKHWRQHYPFLHLLCNRNTGISDYYPYLSASQPGLSQLSSDNWKCQLYEAFDHLFFS